MTDRLQSPNYHYAGFWRRAAAALIDTFLFAMVVAIAIYLLLGSEIVQRDYTALSLTELPLSAVVLENLLPALLTIVLWMVCGGTPGKLLMGCRVIDARTATNVGLGRALLRYLAYFVSLLALCLGFLWIAWDARKQGWHDKIAGTLVIVEDAAQLLREVEAQR